MLYLLAALIVLPVLLVAYFVLGVLYVIGRAGEFLLDRVD